MRSIIRIPQCIAIAVVVTTASSGGCARKRAATQELESAIESGSDEIESIAKTYHTLQLMTPEPVYVNPELAMLCVGASMDMVDDARIVKGPHAHCSVRIFMNDMASAAFKANAKYPAGSIIVKEKERLGFRTGDDGEWQGTGNGVGGMIKRENGYDSPNRDWEYFYFDDLASIESGKMQSCIDCHSNASESDFVFGDWAHPSDADPREL